MSHRPDSERAIRAHRLLAERGSDALSLLPRPIGPSWARSLAGGMDEGRLPCFEPLSAPRLAERRERNRALLAHARPVMETLYQQIAETESMVILTDPEGLILESLGDDDFLVRAQRVALAPGVSWAETERGTNAIGTALVEAAPTLVHGPEHFLAANAFLTCSAVPLCDPAGAPLGVLDVSGDWRGYHRHTMAIVRMSAQLIENHIFAGSFPADLTLHFHPRPEFLGTLCEGMLAFAADGRVLAANQAALFQLGLERAALLGRGVEAPFVTRLAELLDRSLRPADRFTLGLRTGVRVEAVVRPGAGFAAAPRRAGPALRRAPAMAPGEGLAALDTGDGAMRAVLARLRPVIGRDIAILIEGETGTGKELLARALHADGPRRQGPFVTLNCAAIPENLIESELFGYEEGAFTGARRQGYPGKVVQADGGTLFLDEIGDMPLALQARLLRVLQEREVTALGAARSRRVDIAVLAATHRSLRDLVAAGGFRRDLYYRLNGLRVALPPLRARGDLPALIEHILARASAGAAPSIAPAALAILAAHDWPGNIRELANALRTAAALAGPEGPIGPEHLPEELQEVRPAPAAPPASLAAIEHASIRAALAAAGGNVAAAARRLGISRRTIYRKLGRKPGPPEEAARRERPAWPSGL